MLFLWFIGFVIFLIAGVAESHRLPFDIPEAEQEICAGYHTEYSGMKFGMFFVAEYIGLVLISSLTKEPWTLCLQKNPLLGREKMGLPSQWGRPLKSVSEPSLIW